MFETWTLALAIILKILLVLMDTITCFLNELFIVMFNLGFLCYLTSCVFSTPYLPVVSGMPPLF